MGPIRQLESTLDGALNRNAPVKIPPEGRKSLAGALWWIALIVGILQLWSSITLWQWGHTVDRAIDMVNYYAGSSLYATTHLGLFYYLSLIAMAVTAVVALLAVPALKVMKKSGWDMLFYCVLITTALSILRLLDGAGGGFTDFLGTAIGTVIGAWLLFQVRDNFKADVSAAAAHQHTTAADPAHSPDRSNPETKPRQDDGTPPVEKPAGEAKS